MMRTPDVTDKVQPSFTLFIDAGFRLQVNSSIFFKKTTSMAKNKPASEGFFRVWLKAFSGLQAAAIDELFNTSPTVKVRQAERQPLIEQAVLHGSQLKLTNPQIVAVVQSILRENLNEYRGSRCA
jgi:hypothetical protein